MTRQLIIALTVAFVSVPGARAQSGHVAKVLIALENVWVEALVQPDTAKLEAIFLDTYVDTDEGGHQSDKQATLAVLKSGDLKFKSIKLSNMKVYTYGDRSEEHTSELQSPDHLVCRLLLDAPTTDVYTLSLHDALPILGGGVGAA